jgi:hypothetical protein
MTTHVFIVDDKTFKCHLEHMFVGTGATEKDVDFNGLATTNSHHSTENGLVGMCADLNRVRIDDFVIFYLLQNSSHEGKFFGIFKIAGIPFIDSNGIYLNSNLGKKLTFRCLIEPFEVYAKGVSEWEALDEIKNINSPNQMLWSLIYRKLKGNRGNTMITIYETDRLFYLLRCKNTHTQLYTTSGFSFNGKQLISGSSINYIGSRTAVNIIPRLITKYTKKKAFEVHLQAYIMQFIDDRSKILQSLLIGNCNLEWLGNEVSCGVGMQRIDVMLSCESTDTKRFVVPIELKAVPYYSEITNQLQRYVYWLEQYYIPNRHSIICPVIIAKKGSKLSISNIRTELANFDSKNPNCLPVRLIEFELNTSKTDLIFTQTI